MANTRTDLLSKGRAISAGFPGGKDVMSPWEIVYSLVMLPRIYEHSPIARLPWSLVSPSCKAYQLEITSQTSLQTDLGLQTSSVLHDKLSLAYGEHHPIPQQVKVPDSLILPWIHVPPKAWKGYLPIFLFSATLSYSWQIEAICIKGSQCHALCTYTS